MSEGASAPENKVLTAVADISFSHEGAFAAPAWKTPPASPDSSLPSNAADKIAERGSYTFPIVVISKP